MFSPRRPNETGVIEQHTTTHESENPMSTVHASATRSGYVRPRNGRVLAGVCAGLGRKWGMDPNLVRILFVLSVFLPGPQFLAYVAGWVLMPEGE